MYAPNPDELIHRPWYAHPNKFIGGWCIDTNKDDKDDVIEHPYAFIIDKIDNEEIAKHIVELHNMYLPFDQVKRATVEYFERITESLTKLSNDLDELSRDDK